MSFNPLRIPVDYVLLAGKRSPGLADIVGASSPRKWEKRGSYAMGGAFVIYRGIDLSAFSVQIRLYSETDWKAWHEWVPLVRREVVDLAQRRAARNAPGTGAASSGSSALGGGIAGTTSTPTSRIGGGIAGTGPRASRVDELALFRGGRPRAMDIWHPILKDLGIRSVVVTDLLQPRQTADGEWTHEIRFLEYRRPQLAIARPDGSQARPPSTDPVDLYIEDLAGQAQELAAA